MIFLVHNKLTGFLAVDYGLDDYFLVPRTTFARLYVRVRHYQSFRIVAEAHGLYDLLSSRLLRYQLRRKNQMLVATRFLMAPLVSPIFD